MARAVWSGTISFGLVSVPVRLYPATRRKDVRFHEIDRSSGQRVRHQKGVEMAAPTPTLPRDQGRDIHARRGDDVQLRPGLAQMAREVPQPPRGGEAIRPVPQPVTAS